VYPQVVHNGGKFGDNFDPVFSKFVDKRLVAVVTGP
jgi:hypothetical protein